MPDPLNPRYLVAYEATDSGADALHLGIALSKLTGADLQVCLVLPDSYWCYDPLASEPDPGPLPALENRVVTFGCFNTFCKVSAESLALWADVLRTLPVALMIAT